MGDNLNKKFAELVGDCWHEPHSCTKKPSSGYHAWEYYHVCACGHSYKRYDDTPYCKAGTNPTYTIETIKQAIQSVPCGECGGTCWQDNEECDNLSASRRCPHCTDGKRDDWKAMVNYLAQDIMTELKGHMELTNDCLDGDDLNWILACTPFILARVLTTPWLLMQIYISFKESV